MANVTRGYTFGATEQVTNAKLHSLVDDASVGAIADSDIASDADINSSKIAFGVDNFVTLVGNQTVDGVKTFTSAPIVPDTFFSKVYPVGCIYTSTVSTNPATFLGFGTWSAFGAGRCLVGLDAGQTEFDTAEETGGSKTHTLTTDEIPAHTHAFTGYSGSGSAPKADAQVGTAPATITPTSVGGGTAHNNLQPYVVVYFFKRTA